MRLLALNPNTTSAMTHAVVAQLEPLLPSGSTVSGWTAQVGPAVIDSRCTYDAAARNIPALCASLPAAHDAILLACFGDPGLAALRQLATCPVIGLAEAAITEVRDKAMPFAIITAGTQWPPLLRECADLNGSGSLLTGVYPLAGNGRELRANPEAFRGVVLDLSHQAKEEGAVALILGGAAFAGLQFETAQGLLIIDPLRAAVSRLVHACESHAADASQFRSNTHRHHQG